MKLTAYGVGINMGGGHPTVAGVAIGGCLDLMDEAQDEREYEF